MEQKQTEISQDQGRGVTPYTAETATSEIIACIKKTEGAIFLRDAHRD